MPLEAPLASNHPPANGLPPVVPPSGKFIAQLFLVPGLIVSTAVLLLLGFSWLASGTRSPERLLANLKDTNWEIRWRAAHDLAQVLLRDDELASDPKFVLDLAGEMRQALQDNRESERKLAASFPRLSAEQVSDEQSAVQKRVEDQRSSIQYLSACLGNVTIPVGVSLLSETALQEDAGSPAVIALRRRQAVWALANLGANLKRFERLPPERQQAVIAALEAEASTGTGERGAWARLAVDYLHGPQARSLAGLGVESTLNRCAADPDPFVREIIAFALNFWEGSPAENTRLEQLLIRLTHDDGHGEESLARDRAAVELEEEAITRRPGSKIRYNAAVALARRGSDRVPLDLIGEMLDEPLQRDNFRIKRKNGQDTPDEATARMAVVTALQALAELHRKQPARDLSELKPALDRLMQSTVPAIRAEAERTRIALHTQS